MTVQAKPDLLSQADERLACSSARECWKLVSQYSPLLARYLLMFQYFAVSFSDQDFVNMVPPVCYRALDRKVKSSFLDSRSFDSCLAN